MSQASGERLNKYEIGLYFTVWASVVFYSIYEVFLARNDLLSIFGVIIESDGLAPGWEWIGGIREVGDASWIMSIGFLKQIIPWLFVQVFISQTLKHMKVQGTLIYGWYIIYTGVFIWNYCGYDGLKYLLFSPCLMCVFKYFSDEFWLNIATLITLFGNPSSPKVNDLINPISAEVHKFYMMKLAFDWTLLRSLDCHANRDCDEGNKTFLGFMKDAIRSIAYCWYLPTLFMGPYVTYDKFIRNMEESTEKWTVPRVIAQLLNFMRFIFWMYFTEFIMHFVYAHAISIKPYVVMRLNTWAFYGLVFCLGQYFYLQFLVIYGITGEMIKADDIDAPPPPKCIARIHLYSDMWRHFDRGMYEYLVSHVYKRIINWNIPQKRIIATLLTFLFVLVWTPKIHGVAFITLFLNFIGIVVESLAKCVGNSRMYTKLQQRYLTSRNNRRLNCFLAAPLLLFSIAANLYSIHGTQFADHFVNTLLNESFAVIGSLMLVLYCCCQVATEIKLNEKRGTNELNNDEHVNTVGKIWTE